MRIKLGSREVLVVGETGVAGSDHPYTVVRGSVQLLQQEDRSMRIVVSGKYFDALSSILAQSRHVNFLSGGGNRLTMIRYGGESPIVIPKHRPKRISANRSEVLIQINKKT